jgi:hypothetical protein
MTTDTPLVINNAEEDSPSLNTTLEVPKRELYPETNERIKGAALWLGLAFVVMVVLLQQFSGYS